MQLPPGLPATASLISENVLRRELGLLEPPPAVERSLGQAEVERLAGLAPNLVSCLVLFDVLEPVDERFAYRDLVAAREAARLLKRGVALSDVLEASIALRRRGGHLAEARLTEGPSGALVREVAGQLAELSGQLTMRLPMRPEQKARSLDDLLVEAEEADERGDHATAESLYTTAMRADAADPVLPFNLGNVFQAQGRADRGQGGLADRGGARSRVRRGLVQPRPGGRGRAAGRSRRRRSTAAPCRPSPATPTRISTWRCCSPGSIAAPRRSPPGNASSSSNRRRRRRARRRRRSRSAA